jgi:hypothetical protein
VGTEPVEYCPLHGHPQEQPPQELR